MKNRTLGRKKTHTKAGQKIVALLLIFGLLSWSFPVQVARAAPLTSVKDTMETITAAANSNHDILFTSPNGVAAAGTITITFPAGFVLTGVDFADVDVNDDATPLTLAGTCSGATWGLAVSGQVMTLTSCTGTIGAASVVEFLIGTNASGGSDKIDNPSAAGYKIDIATSFPDTGSYAVSIIADDSVNVTATVNEFITFTISDTTIGFGALDSTAARWATADTSGSGTDSAAAHTMTIATNAASYIITYTGATLTATSGTIDVAAITNNADGTQNTEEFGMGFSTDGNATIAAAYDHNATPANRDWAYVATGNNTVVSESVPTSTETISAFYLANIAGTTNAGAYSTNITYIATGTF